MLKVSLRPLKADCGVDITLLKWSDKTIDVSLNDAYRFCKELYNVINWPIGSWVDSDVTFTLTWADFDDWDEALEEFFVNSYGSDDDQKLWWPVWEAMIYVPHYLDKWEIVLSYK